MVLQGVLNVLRRALRPGISSRDEKSTDCAGSAVVGFVCLYPGLAKVRAGTQSFPKSKSLTDVVDDCNYRCEKLDHAFVNA